MILTTVIWVFISLILLIFAFLETLILTIIGFVVWLIVMVIALLIDGFWFGYIWIKNLWRIVR